MAKRLTSLIIRGSEWARGKRPGKKTMSNPLLDNVGKRCCLGIDARASRVPNKCILNVYMPDEVGINPNRAYMRRWCEKDMFGVINNDLTNAAVDINDNPHTTDEEKIKLLEPIFNQVGKRIVWRPNE
jgi:hypothetical protein